MSVRATAVAAEQSARTWEMISLRLLVVLKVSRHTSVVQIHLDGVYQRMADKQAHLDDWYHDTVTTACAAPHMSTINDCVIIIALDLTSQR
jgi:hypothetical protein